MTVWDALTGSTFTTSEIAQAEQNLISGGMPVREVQQLCDVRSALFHGRTDALLKRMREMVYKEEQIFLPLCRDRLTQEEWFAVHRDLDEYKPAFAESTQRWIDADVWAREKELEAKEAFSEGKVRLSTGALSVAQLEAVFKLLPLDLTFIDDGETTRFFTREGKVFARPLSCLGREVWLCHPPEIISMIKGMIADFKSGARESMEVWNPAPGNPVRVVYVPVWGGQREYLGTLEIVQQFGELLPKLKELIG